MELQLEAVKDVASAVRIGKDDLIVGVLGIGLPGFVPVVGRAVVMGIADAGLFFGRFLVGTYSEYEFFNLEASVVVEGVEIYDGVGVVFDAVEVVGLRGADFCIHQSGVIGGVHGKVEPNNTVAAVDGMEGFRMEA